ncbi:MAG: ribosome maturation factor RimM [Acetanaerobacterium sp.]
MKKQFLECGEVVTNHGIHGEVRVYPWCDQAEILASLSQVYLKKGEQLLTVERARMHKNIVIMKFAGYDTLESAATLRRKTLYLNREDMPLAKDEYFVQDLIGSKVVDVDTAEEYGVLTDVLQTGANDVYVVKSEEAERLVPAIEQVIIETDVDAGLIRIRPLPGLFDKD